MFYLHPWEMDSDQPRPAMAWRHQFRLYVGVRTHAAKLDRLLSHFRFGTARQVLETSAQPSAVIPSVCGTPAVEQSRVSA
jgi:hypothetical protein